MSGEKEKKHQKIKAFVERKKTMNAKYCDQNSCGPSKYMDGVNNFCDEILAYIDKL